MNGRTADFSRRDDKLIIKPSKIVKGRFWASIKYHGKPVTHIDPDGAQDGWVPTDNGAGATVLSEPVGAMTWFPNNNTPRDKATFDMKITVPSKLEVAGSGDLKSVRKHAGKETWRWVQPYQQATYLAMISISDYDVYHSTMTTTTGRKLPIWSFIEPKLGTVAAERALIPKIIRYEERRFGPYPFNSAGIVVKETGVGYALETQNRPVFDMSVPVDDLTNVHEWAHQWYGNSVSLSDWGDIWLNEGFATYAEWLWAASHGGPSTAEQFQQAYDDNPASSDLWSPAPVKLTDPADLFGQQGYLRGSMTLEVLRQKVGTHDFFVILRQMGAAAQVRQRLDAPVHRAVRAGVWTGPGCVLPRLARTCREEARAQSQHVAEWRTVNQPWSVGELLGRRSGLRSAGSGARVRQHHEAMRPVRRQA